MPVSEKDPGSPGSFYSQLVRTLIDRALTASEAELRRAHAGTGRVEVTLEIDVSRGDPRWHNTSVRFIEHKNYVREQPLG